MKEKTRPKARIVVIDDHPVLREGLMQLLCGQPDLDCTGTADNTADAKRLVAQSAPDLMILEFARTWAHENLLPQLPPTPTTKPHRK
jgi:DNA-binding NarL/FixJ family response regulator